MHYKQLADLINISELPKEVQLNTRLRMDLHKGIAVFGLAITCSACAIGDAPSVNAQAEPAAIYVQPSAPDTAVMMQDFNALSGIWNVESRSLQRRMAGDANWQVNQMQTKYRILLDGLIAINDTYGTFNDRPMHGIMIRTYDPDINEWQFQWMSQGYPHLTEQVRGRFENGAGVFYGTETNQGRTFKMRFLWTLPNCDHAHWEQAYQDPETGEWETNWTLDLTRP